MMRKRGRENPCFICGHYHKFEEGEVCGICGHKKSDPVEGQTESAVGSHLSAFPTEVVPDFLYLGTYDNASRSELLKAQGISHILNAVATCPNLYRNSFTYFPMPESTTIPFDDCFEFIEQARNGGARVLVHCMSGQSRSPAIVTAYLMRREGLRLDEAVAALKQKRTSINITSALLEQLQQYDAALRGRAQQPGASASSSQHQQAQQAPTFLQFDMSALPSGAAAALEPPVPGNLTFLGGTPGVQGNASQLPAPPAQMSVPLPFAFPNAVPSPSQGFVFGASHAPPQGSGP